MIVRPTLATVDLDALAHNLEQVRALCPSSAVCALVKANAYGHGLVPVGQALAKAGVEWLGVALIEEGMRLRAAGIRTPIMVVGGALDGQNGAGFAAAVQHDLTLCLSSPEQVASLSAAAQERAVTVHIEVDTGMGRLGVSPIELDEFAAALASHTNVRVGGVMTHLAKGDEPNDDFTRLQTERFDALVSRLTQHGVRTDLLHLANSGGVVAFPSTRRSLVRPGLMLYGLEPIFGFGGFGVGDSGAASLRPAMRWTTQIIKIRTLPPGSPVSYGCRWRVPDGNSARIGTLPVGYADGYRRAFSGKASVLVRGRRVPVVGTVCMDLCMIDVTNISGCTVGDEVVLLGAQGSEVLSADELAGWASTISYEIVCGISERVPRRFARHGATEVETEIKTATETSSS